VHSHRGDQEEKHRLQREVRDNVAEVASLSK
jgi:hypothetical protein